MKAFPSPFGFGMQNVLETSKQGSFIICIALVTLKYGYSICCCSTGMEWYGQTLLMHP